MTKGIKIFLVFTIQILSIVAFNLIVFALEWPPAITIAPSMLIGVVAGFKIIDINNEQ